MWIIQHKKVHNLTAEKKLKFKQSDSYFIFLSCLKKSENISWNCMCVFVIVSKEPTKFLWNIL